MRRFHENLNLVVLPFAAVPVPRMRPEDVLRMPLVDLHADADLEAVARLRVT